MTEKKTAEWYNKQLQGLFIMVREQKDMVDTAYVLNRLNDVMSEKGLQFHRNILVDLGINEKGETLNKEPYDSKSPNDARKMLLKGYELYVDSKGVKWWRESIYGGVSEKHGKNYNK